ncbi:MAG: hypothetical protein ACXQS2_01475 [Methermicoccaceae archaeon]
MKMRGVLALMLLLATLTCPIAGSTENPLMDVQVRIKANQTHVLVFVNGVSLNDKIDELQKEYSVVSNHLKLIDSNVYDYILLNEMKSRLTRMHQYAIQALQKELALNDSLTDEQREAIYNEIAKHSADITKIQSDADNILINILMRYQKMISEKESFSYGGYHDIYGDFRYFKEVDDVYLTEDVFRITDCYSELGQSKVLQGGWITIKGISSYGTMTTSRGIDVIYYDPAAGEERKYLDLSRGWFNEWYNYKDFEIKWDKNIFEIKLKIDEDTPEGMKQVTIQRENMEGKTETVKVVFDVVRPQLEVYTTEYDGMIAVTVKTNLDKVRIKYGDEVRELTVQFDRVFTMFKKMNATELTVSGVGDFDFVKVTKEVK